MKKILLFLLISIVGYGQTPTGQEQEFDYGIKNNAATTVVVPNYLTTQGATGVYGKIEPINLSISSATQNALDMKLNISDLPTNLTLYPTTVASDVAGYVKMVTDIHDVDYNTAAVDVSTPTITTTSQLVSQRISAPGILIGQPGVFNITSFGNIRHLSGSGTATFYFRVYHRTAAGVETLICTSGISAPVVDGGYVEFSASGIWNDGEFSATDRIVIKSYANRIAGGSDPIYQFQFGGATPVRTLLPVPFSVVDAGYEMKDNKSNVYVNDGTGNKYYTADYLNGKLPENYAKVVYVNATSPTTATIFDLNNPPVTNDNLLKNDTSNLYIGNDASTWVYNGSTYVTKAVTSTSNFYIENTLTDSGIDKVSNIYRTGGIGSNGNIYSYNGGLTSSKGSSDTAQVGSFLKLNNHSGTENNTFQLNASNGVDLWNFAGGTYNKRFTFSSGGDLIANSFIKIGGLVSQALLANGGVLTNPVNGTGTINYIPKFTTSGTIGNSSIQDSGTLVSISTDMIVNGLRIGIGSGGVSNNSVFGSFALNSNTTGSSNMAVGASSLISNTVGNNNTAISTSALSANTSGSGNIGIGGSSLLGNVSGSNNIGLGTSAGRYIANKTTTATSLSNSIMFGYRTSPLSDGQANQIVIGYDSTGLGSNSTVLGNSSTVQTWLGGRLTVGSTVDDGVNALQLTGSATLKTTPTTSAGTYDILTRNTSTGVVEKVLSSTIATAAQLNAVSSIVYGSDVNLSSGQSPYTLLLTDANARLTTNGVFNQSYSIVVPTNAVVPFQIGTKIRIHCSATQPGFVGLSGSGITFTGITGGIYVIRYGSSFEITKVAIDTWFVEEFSLWKTQSGGNVTLNTDKLIEGNFTGTINASSLLNSKFPVYTVATLPTTIPNAFTGNMAYVTDALAPTYLTVVMGGGAVVCPVFYNGTNWVAH